MVLKAVVPLGVAVLERVRGLTIGHKVGHVERRVGKGREGG